MSLRARLTNALLRMTAKRRWRSGLHVGSIRARAIALDARVNRSRLLAPQETVVINDVPCTWYGARERAANGTLL